MGRFQGAGRGGQGQGYSGRGGRGNGAGRGYVRNRILQVAVAMVAAARLPHLKPER